MNSAFRPRARPVASAAVTSVSTSSRRRRVPAPGGGAGAVAPRRLPPLLRRAWFSLNQAFRRRIAHLGLTPDQYTALRLLAEAGPAGVRQRALTPLMSSDPNTIAALLERMEKAGWVRRQPEPDDRRARHVTLTRTGRRRFEQAREIAMALQTEVLGVLPARERTTFLARLDRVAEACRAAAEHPPPPQAAAR